LNWIFDLLGAEYLDWPHLEAGSPKGGTSKKRNRRNMVEKEGEGEVGMVALGGRII
jgi:hypothetical protein